MNEALTELAEYIDAALPGQVIERTIAYDELTIVVDAASIVAVVTFLRDDSNCLFKQLVDLCGADYPERERRFDVVYNLLSLGHNQRIRVKVVAGEDEQVPTVTEVYSSAGWYEREAWDLYGIPFAGNPDLRRILTDYGFEGHPLRKDFPLTGFVEMRYDEEQKRVVYEPVSLAQDFRSFDFMSPWEGAQYILPGDEKADGEAEKDGA
jgi:NADH-quinone oxidoreductase subunit C